MRTTSITYKQKKSVLKETATLTSRNKFLKESIKTLTHLKNSVV